ncbi:RNA-binding (RRM/RBD/RNP motifs) family protein [Actinidia rufa]|uniref:RNA-binding (RRM/RBD/RNP motifs) family protein n=1 Tax=Actinidia rufa TaxID=165716 RepID=A0A7J0FQ11_9ERIC|nr:RNA-binding (RRM/RBD/RNP motifs) family protein [Actinidia rufa]
MNAQLYKLSTAPQKFIEEIAELIPNICSNFKLKCRASSSAAATAMAAMEAACSLFSSCLPSSPSLRLHISTSNLALSVKSPPYPFPRLCVNATRKLGSFKVFSVVEEIAVEDKPDEKTRLTNPMRKLCVQNLPWSFTVDDMKTVFGEFGTVADIEIIKQKDGKSRGFAFVTMYSGEEAQAVIDKFNSQELLGRVIRVEFAKRFRRPPRPPPASPPVRETCHKLPSGKSAGYGFVSFSTKEEAESVISALDGKVFL